MILSKEKYSKYLLKSLSNASEIWIAVALINAKGFELIRSKLPKGTTQNYLIGINLPSDISVLTQLKKLTHTPLVNAKVFRMKTYFHPKVYIIKKSNGYYDAFIGSSNATNSGINSNIEMNFRITSWNEIEELIIWFEGHFQEGEEITDEFLKIYKDAQARMLNREKQNEKDSNKITKKRVIVSVPKLSRKKWDEQFFKKEHFAAFATPMQTNYTKEANAARKKVKDKLKELHEKIYPEFSQLNIINLKEHYHKQNIISHYDYRKGFTKKERRAIWLHYGKDVTELANYSSDGTDSFVNQIRIQIIFLDNEVGVWLVLGKDFGGKQDRKYFQTKMASSIIYRKDIFRIVNHLPDNYWIEIANRNKNIRSFNNADQFYNFISKDRPDNYFKIGISFSADDKSISERNIAETMLNEIKRLYPLYELMKDKP